LNILIVTPHFWPENFRINDLAEGLIDRGHNISVLTQIPNYPNGKYFDGYGLFKNRHEVYRGIKIYRIAAVPRGSGSNFRLSLNYLSYVFSGLFSSLFLLKNKYDLIFVFEPSPITVGIPAIFIKKVKNIPLCFWVLDLWPESVNAAAKLKTNIIPKLLLPLVRMIYKNCDLILVSSRGFISSIAEKGIDIKKILFFPQWAEDIFKDKKQVFKKNHDLIPDGFIIMFAGNIGESQDFNSIIKAAIELKNEKHIHWVILGKGRKEPWVREQVREHNLIDNFHLLGQHPIDEMPKFYAKANAMLISLKKEHIFSLTVPAKLQSYLAAGKPILSMVDGETGNIIREAEAGLGCDAECPDDLSRNIVKMSKMSDHELSEMGSNAYEYFLREYQRDSLLDKAEDIFNKLLIRKP